VLENHIEPVIYTSFWTRQMTDESYYQNTACQNVLTCYPSHCPVRGHDLRPTGKWTS